MKYKDQLYRWAWKNPKIESILVKDEILKLPLMNGKAIKGKNGNILVERSNGSRVVTTIQGIRKYKGECI